MKLDTNNFFILALILCSESKESWSVRDFEDRGIPKRLAANYINHLISLNILERRAFSGRFSAAFLVDRKALLDLSISLFKCRSYRNFQFFCPSHVNFLDELLSLKVPFVLSGLSGSRPGFRFVQTDVSELYLPIPLASFPQELSFISRSVGLIPCKSRGNVIFHVPRFFKFLQFDLFSDGGLTFPHFFYNFLELMSSSNPRFKEQGLFLAQKVPFLSYDSF